MQLLNDRPPTVKAERKAKGNRRLRKMNSVGWLQKRAVCGKIDSYGASQGHFQCKSGRECHAGRRFHVLVSQRMSTVLRSVCVLFYIARRRFRSSCVLFHRTAVISHTARAFTSPAGDFTHSACFSIVRRRIRAPCVLLHCLSMCSTPRVLLFARWRFRTLRVLFYITRRRFRSSCVLLHERKGKI